MVAADAALLALSFLACLRCSAAAILFASQGVWRRSVEEDECGKEGGKKEEGETWKEGKGMRRKKCGGGERWERKEARGGKREEG